MTEKEKMLRGMLYAPAHDETLLAELAACKAQCQQFNQRAYQAEGIESAQMLLRRLLGAAGRPWQWLPPWWSCAVVLSASAAGGEPTPWTPW